MEILDRQGAVAWRQRQRAEGLTVVFTNGCYDLLHPGHVRFLEDARSHGDRLIVALNTDASVRSMKGEERPITPEADRAEIVGALRSVDAVTLFSEATPKEIVDALVPDVLIKGEDWALDTIVGRDTVEAAGGKVVRIPLVAGFSTSRLIATIKNGDGPLRLQTE